jgi:hypothetical protein
VIIDAVANALKARGFQRPPGSPRLVTRLRRIKELVVSPSGTITLADAANLPRPEPWVESAPADEVEPDEPQPHQLVEPEEESEPSEEIDGNRMPEVEEELPPEIDGNRAPGADGHRPQLPGQGRRRRRRRRRGGQRRPAPGPQTA